MSLIKSVLDEPSEILGTLDPDEADNMAVGPREDDVHGSQNIANSV